MLRLIAFLLIFVFSQARANTPQDKAICKAKYDEARKYLSSANGYLWNLYKNGHIDYDQFMYGQSQTVLKSRFSISTIRNRAYVGRGEECEILVDEAKDRINEVMEPYREIKDAVDSRERPQAETEL